MDFVRALDVFPKIHDDVKQQTSSGAAISIVGITFILTLIFSEVFFVDTLHVFLSFSLSVPSAAFKVSLFLSTAQTHSLEVDVSHGGTLQINFDMLFHRLPCSGEVDIFYFFLSPSLRCSDQSGFDGCLRWTSIGRRQGCLQTESEQSWRGLRGGLVEREKCFFLSLIILPRLKNAGHDCSRKSWRRA